MHEKEVNALEDRIEQRLNHRARNFKVAVITLLVIQLITVTVVGISFAITRKGLCTFTDDRAEQIQRTERILNAPKNKGRAVVDLYGLKVRRSVVENQLLAQKQTLNALGGLHC